MLDIYFMLSRIFATADYLKRFSVYSDLVFDIDSDVDWLPTIMEEVQYEKWLTSWGRTEFCHIKWILN